MISKDRILLQKQIYNFLRSLTIKFSPNAEYINATVERNGYAVNAEVPSSWKYYLNMQGKYHISDTLMKVVSLDTQAEILFSPEVLVNHPRTRSVYMPGGLYYKRLCATYPDQVDLIKSILFPVTDIQKAIDADDLTLLQYGSGYLEEWEEKKIIMELEKFLATIKERWYFDFLWKEPYFYITFWGSLWFKLAAFIMVTRETLVHTPYVHSWHLWNELIAQGLDDYSDVLDREKSMFLYQNIDYFKGNAGKQSNLLILADRLLKDFNVSIYGRRLVQEAESASTTFELTPQLEAVRILTSNRNTVTADIGTISVPTIQTQIFEKGLSPYNTEEASLAIERKLGDTTLNRTMTKFLEIRPYARNKVYANLLNVFLMDTLATTIINGYYNIPVQVSDNATGFGLYLYPKELLAIYHYATQRSLGLTPTEIPTQLSISTAFTPQIDTPNQKIYFGDELLYVSMHYNVDTFYDGMAYNTSIRTPAEFSEMVSTQWLRYLENVVSEQDTLIERRSFILKYLVSMCQKRRLETMELVSGFTTYEEWFGAGGIDIASTLVAQYDLKEDPKAAWGNLADSITTALIPITDVLDLFGNFTLSDFGYSRLRQLFVQMCSYRVVFLESSRETSEFSIGGKWSTRYGPDHGTVFGDRTIIRYQRNIDTQIVTTPVILLPGVCNVLDTMAETPKKYTVNTVTKKLKDRMLTAGETIKGTIKRTGVNVTQGVLNLPHPGMVPVPEQDPTLQNVLIDIDRSPLKDSDDGLITDNN